MSRDYKYADVSPSAPEGWKRMGADHASTVAFMDYIREGRARIARVGDYMDRYARSKAHDAWAGRVRDWEHAAQLAEQGVDASFATFAIEQDVTGHGVARRTMHDVAGGVVDVGRYLAGAPDCMVRRQPLPRPLMVSIGIQVCASASADARVLSERGRRLYAAVQSIEATGARVQVDAVMTVEAYQKPDDWHAHTVATLKSYGEPIDPQVLAYWLTHPSAMRWWMFAAQAVAVHPHMTDEQFLSFASSQGQPRNPPESVVASQWDVYFPGFRGALMMNELETAEEVCASALTAAKARREAGR